MVISLDQLSLLEIVEIVFPGLCNAHPLTEKTSTHASKQKQQNLTSCIGLLVGSADQRLGFVTTQGGVAVQLVRRHLRVVSVQEVLVINTCAARLLLNLQRNVKETIDGF